MLVSDFDYELPEELIAQTPPAERGNSRMLVVSRKEQRFRGEQFAAFASHVGPGDCVVLNRTRVFPARLRGRRVTGGEIEVFLVRAMPGEASLWKALVRPAKRVRTGDKILFSEELAAEVVERGEYGERVLRFSAAGPLDELFERLGSVPLPPYIHRTPDEGDRERYQTVFAEKRGSAAAPTAGLHFTQAMLDACRAAGAEIAFLTLHVGLGTFAPLRENQIEKIQLHEEYFEIDDKDAAKMRGAQRRICVGTTSVRAVETAMLRGGLKAMQGDTNLFISPGFQFRATDALLTNFHLPQSSLLILVSAFAGKDLVLEAYRHAVRDRYRFFSYGDCMLIV